LALLWPPVTVFDVFGMEQQTKIYEAMLGWGQRGLAQTAPVAAKFKDCRQCFDRLCAALQTHSSLSDAELARENYARFLTWGIDTGAMDRSLHRTLRKSSDMREMTLELLTSLHSALKRGMCVYFSNISQWQRLQD
jgi:hypothetical protein